MTFLLVELEDGLSPSRVTGLFAAIRQHPGVAAVCDLSAISQETLNGMLLPVPTVRPKKQRKAKAAA